MGKLYLIPTPIGNMDDMTLRALDVLRSVDHIYCEDTRNTRNLLTHYDIHKVLKSYHPKEDQVHWTHLSEKPYLHQNIGPWIRPPVLAIEVWNMLLL